VATVVPGVLLIRDATGRKITTEAKAAAGEVEWSREAVCTEDLRTMATQNADSVRNVAVSVMTNNRAIIAVDNKAMANNQVMVMNRNVEPATMAEGDKVCTAAKADGAQWPMTILGIMEMNIVIRVKADIAGDNKAMEVSKGMVVVDKGEDNKDTKVSREIEAADKGRETGSMMIRKDVVMADATRNPGVVQAILAGSKDKVVEAVRTGTTRVTATVDDMEAGKGRTEAEVEATPGIVTGPPEIKQGASPKVVTANPAPLATRKAQVPEATKKRIHLKILPVKP
jgi:hypothetical protein